MRSTFSSPLRVQSSLKLTLKCLIFCSNRDQCFCILWPSCSTKIQRNKAPLHQHVQLITNTKINFQSYLAWTRWKCICSDDIPDKYYLKTFSHGPTVPQMHCSNHVSYFWTPQLFLVQAQSQYKSELLQLFLSMVVVRQVTVIRDLEPSSLQQWCKPPTCCHSLVVKLKPGLRADAQSWRQIASETTGSGTVWSKEKGFRHLSKQGR